MKINCQHIGYFNEPEDIEFLKDLDAEQILSNMFNIFGSFHFVNEYVEDIEDEKGQYAQSGRFLVIKDINNGGEDDFIDIYEI